jgi:23S rRNA maturation-related 3'-5' exoribonuclease YhaM
MAAPKRPPQTLSEIIDHIEQLHEKLRGIQTALEKLEPSERPEKIPGKRG